MTKKLEALYDAVIVKPVKEEEQTGLIIRPDFDDEVNKFGEVIAVGPGKNSMFGFIDTTLRVGDKVVLPTMGFSKFEFKGVEYFIGKENEVLAKISDESEDTVKQ